MSMMFLLQLIKKIHIWLPDLFLMYHDYGIVIKHNVIMLL